MEQILEWIALNKFNILASFVISIIAAVVLIISQYLRNLYLDYRDFKSLQGNYDGYGLVEDGYRLEKEPQSKATIIFNRRNLLNIKVDHGDNTWEGTIIMHKEYRQIGEIAWRYTKINSTNQELHEKDFRQFGFTKLIRNQNLDEIYLIGRKEYGFGKEVFKRVK